MAKQEASASAKKTVSFPRDLLTRGIERAEEQQRNFSSYVQSLIARDLLTTRKAAAKRKVVPA